jgi:hypothetical protein
MLLIFNLVVKQKLIYGIYLWNLSIVKLNIEYILQIKIIFFYISML